MIRAAARAAARPATTVRRSCGRSAAVADGGAGAARTRRSLKPGEAAGPLLGGTVTQLLASLGTPFAFVRRRVACCSSKTSGSARIASTGCSHSSRQAGLLARAQRSSSASCPHCDEPGGDPRIRDGDRPLPAIFPVRCCSASRPVIRPARRGPCRLASSAESWRRSHPW